MRVGALVASHQNYTIPLERCIKSLAAFGDRVIVIGGYSEQRVTIAHGSVCIEAAHNSFDYTGLIEVVNHPALIAGWTHVLCLQDTMEASPLTLDLAMSANRDAACVAACGGQCNLVLYRVDHLMERQVFIREQSNLSKLSSIHHEGSLWKTCDESRRDVFCGSGCLQIGHGTPYSDVPRIKEYYPALGIVKWKANWGHNMHALIEAP